MTDLLREEYTIDTPENVSFGYEVAGIGNRFIGALIDTILLALAYILIYVVVVVILAVANQLDNALFVGLVEELSWFGGVVLAFSTLLTFLLVWGYYILFELNWNGQTPGKRFARIRVVRMDGNPAGLVEIVVRNLVRIIDFLPVAYGVGFVTMFCNRHARRLGDFAAGTLVVKDRGEIGLESLAQRRPVTHAPATADEEVDPLLQRFPEIRRLSTADYELITEVLARHTDGRLDTGLMYRVAAAIAQKLMTTPPPRNWPDTRKFLTDAAEAYRRYQT
jgi:uncharacterized RDD family membrane protein YckC